MTYRHVFGRASTSSLLAPAAPSIQRRAQTLCARCYSYAALDSRSAGSTNASPSSRSAISSAHPRNRHLSSAPLPSPLHHPDYENTSKHAASARGRSNHRTTRALPASDLAGYGQPLPSTHPHLLEHGQLTIGIPYSEYEDRRRRLMASLPDDRSIVILAGGRLQYASQGIFYKFRQASDFFYLTGWLEQDAAVILEKAPSTKRGYEMTIFCRSRDPEAELWDGPRNGPNGAVDIFGADRAMDIALFTSHLKSLLTHDNTSGTIYVDLPDSATAARPSRTTSRASKSIFNFLSGSSSGARRTSMDLGLSQRKSDYETVVNLLGVGAGGGRNVKSLRELTESMRMMKSDNEIKLMRQAADISGDAHARVMRLAEAGRSEHDLVTRFDYECSMRGSLRQAYLPVCASGRNSQYLHYTANNAMLEAGSMVLLDAGCEYGSYASDITRTFPVSGKFTDAQKDLYTVVLRTLKSCVKMCYQSYGGGGTTLYDLHNASRQVMREELKQIGVHADDKLLGIIYPHFVGHPLGLDLHDCPSFQRSTRLQAGNVVTIEPGVYMPDDDWVPKAFRGMTIRLEDEVLVGADHPTVLSVNAPLEIVDVEACCQGLLEA